MLARGDHLLTSALSVGEVLVKPAEKGNDELCQQYEEAITRAALVIPFDLKAARLYASIRCDRSLRAPMLCNSLVPLQQSWIYSSPMTAGLQRKRIDGIQFIVSLDEAPI